MLGCRWLSQLSYLAGSQVSCLKSVSIDNLQSASHYLRVMHLPFYFICTVTEWHVEGSAGKREYRDIVELNNESLKT